MWCARPPLRGSSAGARPVNVASRNSALSRSAAMAGISACLWLRSAAMRAVSSRVVWPISTCFWVSFERAVEQLDDARRDRQALGGAGGIGIGARGFGDDRDANRVGVRLGRRDVAARRLDVAADAAEQVDLIGDLEAGVEAGGGVASARDRGRGLPTALAPTLRAAGRPSPRAARPGLGRGGRRLPGRRCCARARRRSARRGPDHRRAATNCPATGASGWTAGELAATNGPAAAGWRRRPGIVRPDCCRPPARAPRRGS